MIVAMSPTHFLSKARGPRNLVTRIRTILDRFGISSKRFDLLLKRYSDVTQQLGCVPTFPITAVTLARHPDIIKELYRQGAEFAVHGYIHTDYKTLPLAEHVKHFRKAIATFDNCQVPFTGFRAPFLHINGITPRAINHFGFPYDSSHVINWPVVNLNEYSQHARNDHERLLDFYQPKDANKYMALPRPMNGFLEIPVSIPDDEAMVDRLGITDRKKISKIWGSILEETYSRGELFTVQLHPERIFYCETALADIVQRAKELDPPVWVATLREITEWWNERDKFAFKLHSQDNDRYRVEANCSDRATVLLKNSKLNVPFNKWFDGYQRVTAKDFILESPVRPIIGVSRDSCQDAIRFLQREGYIVEQSDQPDKYGIYLSDLAKFNEADEKSLSLKIEQSSAPLLRYWRWPDQARSALSVTGDIDSITLIDFALRIYENWRQNSKSK